jgi:RNA polymerase sigma-32 factor
MPSIARVDVQDSPLSSPAGTRAHRAPRSPKETGSATVLHSVAPWEVAPPSKRARVSSNDSGTVAQPHARTDSHSTLTTYLRDLARYPLMTREEEHRIAVEFVETGDPRLASQLATANLRLVLKIALEYRRSNRNLLDLVQEGNLGLLHAVHKYDPRRGVKLATYASWWIRAYVLKFILSNARLVKLGTTQAQRRLFFGLRRERARLEGRDGQAVDTRQLAAAFDVSEKEVVDMERRISSCESSLDWPSRGSDADGRPRGDVVSAEETLRPDVQSEAHEFRAVLLRELQTFRSTLTGRDAEIFEGRLMCEEATTLAEIATRFGVSRERVRQIEERLKQRLRRFLQTSLGDAVPLPMPTADA